MSLNFTLDPESLDATSFLSLPGLIHSLHITYRYNEAILPCSFHTTCLSPCYFRSSIVKPFSMDRETEGQRWTVVWTEQAAYKAGSVGALINDRKMKRLPVSVYLCMPPNSFYQGKDMVEIWSTNGVLVDDEGLAYFFCASDEQARLIWSQDATRPIDESLPESKLIELVHFTSLLTVNAASFGMDMDERQQMTDLMHAACFLDHRRLERDYRSVLKDRLDLRYRLAWYQLREELGKEIHLVLLRERKCVRLKLVNWNSGRITLEYVPLHDETAENEPDDTSVPLYEWCEDDFISYTDELSPKLTLYTARYLDHVLLP